MKWTIAFLLVMVSWGGPLYGQTPAPMTGGPESSPQELQRMKEDIKAARTDAANFEKRAEFARMWITLLVTQGKADELQRFAPPGTIPRIKQAAGTSPGTAYRELDSLFRELEKIDQPLPAPHAAPKMQSAGIQDQPLPALRPAPGVASKEMFIINPTSSAQLWAKLYYPVNAGAHAKLPALIYLPGALGYGSDPIVANAAEIIAADGFAVIVFDPDGRGKSGERKIGTAGYNRTVCGRLSGPYPAWTWLIGAISGSSVCPTASPLPQASSGNIPRTASSAI